MQIQNRIFNALLRDNTPQKSSIERLKGSSSLLARFYEHLIDDWFCPYNFYKYEQQHGYFDLCDDLEQLGLLKKVQKESKWYFKKML